MTNKQYNWMQSSPIGSLKSETEYFRKERLSNLPQERRQKLDDFRSGYITYQELKQELELLNGKGQ